MPLFTGLIPSAIGSFPHQDPEQAVDLIFEYFPEIPLWPQLPNTRFLENMYAQYAAPIPGARFDEDKERVFIDSSLIDPETLESFYSRVLEEDTEYFRLPESHAAGFYCFLQRLERKASTPFPLLKGHVTGPFSFGLSVPDANLRAIIYDEELFEAAVSALALNAKWQVHTLARYADKVIVFIDEPYLVSYGSAYVSLDRERVTGALARVVDAIKNAGGLAGIHCCGNTDWSLVLDTGLDILSFDAYQFFPNLLLYRDALQAFLDRGGIPAWGIVPSSGEALDCQTEELVTLLLSHLNDLKDRLGEAYTTIPSGLITPACGLGSLSSKIAENAVRKTRAVSLEIQSRLRNP